MDLKYMMDSSRVAEVSFGDTKVKIRYVPAEDLRAISKKATTVGWDNKHRKSEMYDEDRASELLGRAAVVGWEGFTVNGEPFPYTPENCDLMMRRHVGFSKFVGDSCTDVQALIDAEMDEKIKNS